jgi:hypothetical protein
MLYALGKNSERRLMLLSHPPEALSFTQSIRKELSLFEKGLVSCSKDRSGDAIECRNARG